MTTAVFLDCNRKIIIQWGWGGEGGGGGEPLMGVEEKFGGGGVYLGEWANFQLLEGTPRCPPVEKTMQWGRSGESLLLEFEFYGTYYSCWLLLTL